MVSTDDCLIYAYYKSPMGYGRNSKGAVHRQMYEHFVGLIPDGLEIDHLCKVKSCINPDHLEPVNHSINILRAKVRGKFCTKGHELTPENSYYGVNNQKTGNVTRWCKRCHLDRSRERYQRLKGKTNE